MFRCSKTGEHDYLANFLSGVRSDKFSRERLRKILRQPSFHRRSLLNTAIQQMQLRGEDADTIRALAYLKNDKVAGQALAAISIGSH